MEVENLGIDFFKMIHVSLRKVFPYLSLKTAAKGTVKQSSPEMDLPVVSFDAVILLRGYHFSLPMLGLLVVLVGLVVLQYKLTHDLRGLIQ